ncbi:hypothetical protein [Fictibacillus sp. UD]|uniref:hypothetical protein n=1 Tax=Fictibacillus sp. UD TaxID=3038777 RepID=UPI003747B6E5
MRDSCGTSGQVRHLMAQSGKGLTACPAESEQPGPEINHIQEQHSIPKLPYQLRNPLIIPPH